MSASFHMSEPHKECSWLFHNWLTLVRSFCWDVTYRVCRRCGRCERRHNSGWGLFTLQREKIPLNQALREIDEYIKEKRNEIWNSVAHDPIFGLDKLETDAKLNAAKLAELDKQIKLGKAKLERYAKAVPVVVRSSSAEVNKK